MNILLPLVPIAISIPTVADENAELGPAEAAKENTLEFLTVRPQEGERWSKVWVVAVDHQISVTERPRGSGRAGRRPS